MLHKMKTNFLFLKNPQNKQGADVGYKADCLKLTSTITARLLLWIPTVYVDGVFSFLYILLILFSW